MATTLYSDNVVCGGSTEPLGVLGALIEVDGGLISAVRPCDRAALAHQQPVNLVDLGERLISPAFINAHTHLALCALRGLGTGRQMRGNVVEELYFALERFFEPADVRAFTRVGAYECLLCGVGAVWDHYYHAREVAAALCETGLSGVVAPTLQDRNGPGVPHCEAQLEATIAMAQDVGLAEAGVVAALGPHATDTVSSELWRRVAQAADDHDLFIHAHVGQSIEEFERSIAEHGCSPVEQLARDGVLDAGAGMLLVHGMFVDAADLDRLDPARHLLGHCPLSQMQFGFPAHVGRWWRRGLRVVVGTDCAACNDSMNVQNELRVLAGASVFATTHSDVYRRYHTTGTLADARAVQDHRRAAFESASELRDSPVLLSTVWSNPGPLIAGLPLGEIRAGSRANLAVWDLDHPALWPSTAPLRALAMSDPVGALYGLMVNGRWTGELGRHQQSLRQSDAYQDARCEASERLEAVLMRAGRS